VVAVVLAQLVKTRRRVLPLTFSLAPEVLALPLQLLALRFSVLVAEVAGGQIETLTLQLVVLVETAAVALVETAVLAAQLVAQPLAQPILVAVVVGLEVLLAHQHIQGRLEGLVL
jgi:hypothetical protein